MKAYSIDSQNQAVKEIEIEMQANTVYSFFNSILIDELTSLNGHVIYSDANAISEEKKPFFMGEQLIVGDALIIGQEGMSEIDAWIIKADLESLINYDIPLFYTEAFKFLKESNINLYKLFKLDDEEDTELNVEWVLHVFSIADPATQDYFLNELRATVDKKEDIQKSIQKMAKLAFEAANF